MTNNKHSFDLEDRTAKFSEGIINFLKKLPQNIITQPLISQLIRSATSVGANYCEANEANSKKDFVNKIFICKKEAQETKHWLRMLSSCLDSREAELKILWKEAQELTLIFQKIVTTARSRQEALRH